MQGLLTRIVIFIIWMMFIPITAFTLDHISVSNEKESLKELLIKGEILYQKGDIDNAALTWESAIKQLDIKKQPQLYLDTIVHLADAYQSIGYYQKAISALHKTLPIVIKNNDSYRNIQFLNKLGVLYYSFGELKKSFKYLVRGVEEARKTKNPYILANILNNLGNSLTAEKDYESAMIVFEEALDLIEKSPDDIDLKSKILVNLFRVEIQYTSYDILPDRLNYIVKQIFSLPDSHNKAADLISISRLISQYKETFPYYYDKNVMSLHYKVLDDAKRIAIKFQDNPLTSYAYGYLGSLYEMNEQYLEAKKLTRSAIFFAMQGKNPEILYLWEWQSGRLFKANGDIDSAIKAYKKSISTLEPIRIKFFVGFRAQKDTFNKLIKPVYLGLTELLLIQAGSIKDEKLKQRKLLEAIKTMELLKTAELQDFFEDECTIAMQNKQVILNHTPEHVAVLYPILLPHKIIVLLILPDGIRQVPLEIGFDHLEECIMVFRKRLQIRTNNRFLYEAWQLYDWIIRPIEKLLESNKIDTIIFAPDGLLRLVPLSTLHDGKKFLIEKFAVGLIPAISLTDPKKLMDNEFNILINGLSDARQGFSGLPSVKSEVRDIKKIMNGKIALQNDKYTIENLTNEFKQNDYSIVHIATHGVFGGSPKESFLLTYESKLNMNQLENLFGINKFRKRQVELLTLSACQTAMGNERAALGLAGVAVKAGVRSAIATLWYVDDEATSLAIREFYRQLKKPDMTKIKALQNAQNMLIHQPRYWHPLYWAPFLLIGNWM